MKKIVFLLFFIPVFCFSQKLAPPVGTKINWGNPLTQGLVAAFPMNEGGGKKAVDATGLTTGTAGAWTATTANYVTAQRGIAGNFINSTGQIITAGTTTSTNLSSPTTYGTISAWIYPNRVNAISGIVSKGDLATADRNGYSFWVHSDGNIGLEIASASASTVVFGVTALTANKWYHVVATWSNTTGSVYINGRLNNSASNSIVSKSDVLTFRIGTLCNSSNVATLPFSGYIQNVKVWYRCLTATEVVRDFVEPYGIYYKNKNY